MKTLVGAVLELSGGNIRNTHFYLNGLPWLPASVVGGANASDVAKKKLTVTFEPGRTVETDVAGDKMILRERGAVGDFFERISAVEGTRIVIERIDAQSIRVSKLR